MKKVYLILTGVCIISILANAQYKINKTMYDYRTYTYQEGDPYNPTTAGITSFIIPGLGQMMSGEVGRGFGFLGGCIGSMVISSAGVLVFAHSVPWSESEPIHEGEMLTGFVMVVVGIGGMISIDIWSVVDAVRVAKVNDLAFRNRNKTSYNINIQPYINISTDAINSTIPLGLSLKITF